MKLTIFKKNNIITGWANGVGCSFDSVENEKDIIELNESDS